MKTVFSYLSIVQQKCKLPDRLFRHFLKFMFSKKITKIDENFIVDLTLCTMCQTDSEDFVNFCGLLRKHELYKSALQIWLFWRDFAKSQTRTAAILLSCPGTILHEFLTTVCNFFCNLLLTSTYFLLKNTRYRALWMIDQ